MTEPTHKDIFKYQWIYRIIGFTTLGLGLIFYQNPNAYALKVAGAVFLILGFWKKIKGFLIRKSRKL